MDTSQTLKALYDNITGLTSKGVEVNRNIAYYKRHGELPGKPDAETVSNDLAELKHRRTRLNDNISKLHKKLKPTAKGVNADKRLDWELKLDAYQVEREALLNKIKEVESAIS